MASTRRELLAAGAAGLAGMTFYGALAKRAAAAPEREIAVKPAVVAVFLRGGQDALNTLVPYTEGKYYDMRPNIAVPPPNEENGAIDLDGRFGLNPGLTGFKTLWDKGLLAPIVNVGMHHPSRSHFDCQDFMEYGAPGDKSVRDGWLNRFLSATSGPDGAEGEFRAVAMQGRLPRSMRGKYPVLAVPDQMLRGGRRRGEEDVLDLFDEVYGSPPSMKRPGMTENRPDEDELTQNGRTTIETLRKLEEILETKERGKVTAYPAGAGRLGQQLKLAARVLKSGQGVQCIAIDWNGWDHHIEEGGASEQDRIRVMLTQMGLACETFMRDIDGMKNNVTLMLMTEFGRTNRENGNFGTDHGHGSNMYLIGGKIAGKRVYGDWDLSANQRDLKVTTDFRDVFREVLYDHLKLHPSKSLFKGHTPRETKLGLYRS